MNITNNGKKIVNIGELALLPGMTAPLPKAFEGNPVVGFLIERGTLVCDQPFCSKAPEAPLNDYAADDISDDADPVADDVSERIKAIKKMNRAALDAACADAGIVVEDGDTIPTLQKKLIEKLQEG